MTPTTKKPSGTTPKALQLTDGYSEISLALPFRLGALITIQIVKTPHPIFAAGNAVLAALQAEATLSRLAVDDDTTKAPETDCLATPQSRRLPVTVHS